MLSSILSAADSDGGGAALFFLFAIFAVAILVIVAWWKIFEKAGEAGWKAIIPIYNAIVLLRISGKPGWWVVLFFIPLVNFVVAIVVCVELASSSGTTTTPSVKYLIGANGRPLEIKGAFDLVVTMSGKTRKKTSATTIRKIAGANSRVKSASCPPSLDVETTEPREFNSHQTRPPRTRNNTSR